MHEKKPIITIKGNREGLTLMIDDEVPFEEALVELKDKLQSTQQNKNEPVVSVKVQSGNRFVDEEKQYKLRDMIEGENHFKVTAIETNVVHRDEALRWKEESEIKTIHRIIRSGQVLKVTGDLLLIGDVNPGGKVMATGNIYVLGNLFGIAHAGYKGDRSAFIAASYMKPTQLRIADYISRAPDYEADGVYMECGIIDENEDKIIIDSLKLLSRKRNEISGFERRMQNG
ncbi:MULTISPECIES: septum site-determining protein MinC [Oceanobacillus]|uniref:Probable septum site-determining protein MinC n=1 Tax=Oceanobacillus indicireducens TaxID=1004261 RepID=A0A917XVC5_9BACI|nr:MULTISPECIES: septum site-determining protein MinC [Oceanobacillus]GGN55373.1 putative septum site-determining protein MinC [Oceanobacillus indicireducens]